jgi:hypothetical protein
MRIKGAIFTGLLLALSAGVLNAGEAGPDRVITS